MGAKLKQAAALAIVTLLQGATLASGQSPAAQAAPASLVPDNPCYNTTCGPTEPVVVEYPTAGAGQTGVHPDGQTNLWSVKAAQAWALTKGSSSIRVAVLDTGVDIGQAQLQSKVDVGPNFCAQDDPLCSGNYDENGHGTFATGLIGAETNDGIGIASLGWNTRVLALKVLDNDGYGEFADESDGIRYATAFPGVRVINLGWADALCGPKVPESECGAQPVQEDAIDSAVAHGIVVVAPAGDNDSGKTIYPADYPGVLAVAASTDQAVVDPVNGGPNEDFSNYGDDAEIAAPGFDELSTWYDGNYAVMSGSSFAAPLVAAAAALVLAADPRLSGPQVVTLLLQTSSPLGPSGVTINGGFLDVGAAVQAAKARQIPTTLSGYQLFAANATAYNYGFVAAQEPQAASHPRRAVVGGAETPSGLGYWMVTSNGTVMAVGGAHNYGPPPAALFGQPIVGMAATPDGQGYWLVGKEGGVFAFGDAVSYGSLAGHRPSKPIVGMAATPDGHGYWLVSANGDVFNFGDAHYYGSTAKIRLSKPIVAIAASPDGHGYWLVGSDGGIFNFGDATWYGSEVGKHPGQPIVGMAVSPGGQGYWLAGRNGRVWPFGLASYEAAAPSNAPSAPIVGISS